MLSSIQSEDTLSEKAKGTFLVRFSTSNPGSYAISSLGLDGSIKHYKIWHQPGESYVIGKDSFPTLEALIENRKEPLNLKFPCPKGESYSDSNFWVISVLNENEEKTVISLKKLCFRFIYKNRQLFPDIEQKIPMDLNEAYHSTIIDSFTSDENGRVLWKVFFLGRVKILLFFLN